MSTNNSMDASSHGAFLKFALQDLSKNGAKNLCPDRIAQLSGINNVYEDADALRIALATKGFSDLEKRLSQSTPASLPFEERLFQACKSYLSMAQECPALLQLMFSLKNNNDKAPPATLKEAGDKAFTPLEHIITDAIAKDVLKTNDSRSATLATWSFIHGSSFLIIREGKSIEENPEELNGMFQKLFSLLSKDSVSAKPN